MCFATSWATVGRLPKVTGRYSWMECGFIEAALTHRCVYSECVTFQLDKAAYAVLSSCRLADT